MALSVCPCVGQSRRDTLIDVEAQVRALYGVVLDYRANRGAWPSTLNEACDEYPSPRCPPLGIDDTIPVDSWGLPIYYTRKADGFEIRSLGPDRRPGTADDLAITYPDDRFLARRIAGCYRPMVGWWKTSPGVIRLDTLSGTLFDYSGGYLVQTALPRGAGRQTEWFPTSPDSISLQWADGTQVRMLRLKVSGDTLRGRADFDDINWRELLTLVRARCST
jgi:hypothetical protein